MGFLDTVKKFAPSVLSLGGDVIGAYGQYKAGQDAKDVYEYNKQWAKFQSKYIDEKAGMELDRLRRDVLKVIQRKRAIQGRSGTEIDFGSNLQSIINTEQEAELDAAVIRREAEIQKELLDEQARLAGKMGAAVGQAGLLQAGATILGGLSKWDWRLQDIKAPTAGYNKYALTPRQMSLGV